MPAPPRARGAHGPDDRGGPGSCARCVAGRRRLRGGRPGARGAARRAGGAPGPAPEGVHPAVLGASLWPRGVTPGRARRRSCGAHAMAGQDPPGPTTCARTRPGGLRARSRRGHRLARGPAPAVERPAPRRPRRRAQRPGGRASAGSGRGPEPAARRAGTRGSRKSPARAARARDSWSTPPTGSARLAWSDDDPAAAQDAAWAGLRPHRSTSCSGGTCCAPRMPSVAWTPRSRSPRTSS